jgi:hypothetical protein
MRNDRGIALVMVLVLSLIALAVVSAMIFMITQETRISGGQRFFRTAEEASIGGIEIMTEFIMKRGSLAGVRLSGLLVTADPCLQEKLNLAKAAWTGNCTAVEQSLMIDPGDDQTFDVRFDLGNYRVFAKIVDTVDGNSEAASLITGGGGLGGGGVVSSTGAVVTPPHTPYLYRIEIQAEDAALQREQSRLSVLYAY